MIDPETDELLRQRFAAAREADRATTPSFAAVRDRRTMFSHLVETRRGGGEQARWAFPISLGAHVAIGGVLVGASYLVFEAVKGPEARIDFFSSAAPPPPPPAPPPPPPAASRAQSTLTRIDAREILLAVETLEAVTIAEAATAEGGEDVGVLGGAPHGVDGGVLDGVDGGVLGRALSRVLGGVPSTGPVVLTPEMEQPVLEHRVVPEYPELARHVRMQGNVIVQAVIEADGTVSDVTVLRASNPVFSESAIAAVRQWRYRPAMQNGRPVAVYFTVVVEFILH